LTKLYVLIVHAHHEPKSFCSALFRHAVQTFCGAGHSVFTSDLHAQQFDPVSDRRNFTSMFDADYLRQGKKERHATAVDGFAPDLECEIRKLESCDLLVFSAVRPCFASCVRVSDKRSTQERFNHERTSPIIGRDR
jgi:putative NADPH-quinone reductase